MGREKAIVISLILIGMVVVSGCVTVPITPPEPFEPLDDTGSTAEGVAKVVGANNQFAFELYSELKNDSSNDGENIFFSPYSISTALAMTYEGARGQTAEEMATVFYFPEDENERRPNFARVYNDINSGGGQLYQLKTANALWAQQDFQFSDDYFNVIEDYYGGKVTNLDFVGDPDGSRSTINGWVEQKTNNKIKDILGPGTITALTRLILTNAIYFKGTWVYQFDPSQTGDRNFYITPENLVQVPMMHLDNDDAKFNYMENSEFQIIELPYKGDELSMLIILPHEDLASIEGDLDVEKLKMYREMMHERNMEVYLPKFTFETKYQMKDTLSGMGMPLAFSPSADFSGMTGSPDLYIDFVIHQAFVDVNEEGTEAAAATAVGMTLSAGNWFRVDHPFIFIIQQQSTGNILFMGRVVDPR